MNDLRNKGKIFEEDFIKSVPKHCYLHRIKDTSQSYQKSENTKFTRNNPCDFFMFDTINRLFYAIECKSTKSKSMNYQTNKDDDSSKMIKYHQIESLKKISNFNGTVAGLLLNFRNDDTNLQRTYFIHINDFENMRRKLDKKSFNEMDLILNKAIKIQGNKKRTRYSWDIEEFLNSNNETVL